MATPAMMPAGWYADPTRRHECRYWGGTDWTGAVSDGAVTATDPLEFASQPPPSSPQPPLPSPEPPLPSPQHPAEFSPVTWMPGVRTGASGWESASGVQKTYAARSRVPGESPTEPS